MKTHVLVKIDRVVSILLILLLLSLATYSQKKIRPRILRICKDLQADTGLLHLGGRVGYALKPEKNKYVRNYKKLIRIASNEELISLTNHTDKTIVLYAYSVLRKREYPNLKDIFLNNIADTSTIWVTGGSTGVIWRVNEYMLSSLDPNYSKGTLYLSKEEFNSYQKQISCNK
jgi:hypothetical protein